MLFVYHWVLLAKKMLIRINLNFKVWPLKCMLRFLTNPAVLLVHTQMRFWHAAIKLINWENAAFSGFHHLFKSAGKILTEFGAFNKKNLHFDIFRQLTVGQGWPKSLTTNFAESILIYYIFLQLLNKIGLYFVKNKTVRSL